MKTIALAAPASALRYRVAARKYYVNMAFSRDCGAADGELRFTPILRLIIPNLGFTAKEIRDYFRQFRRD